MSTSIHYAVGSAFNFLTRAAPTVSKHSFEEFGPLLELNDKISQELTALSQEEKKSYELDPPRIVVVGLTSAGKSSLLERIIGFKIFPVRDNVCTRRPFRCQIKKSSSDLRHLRFMNSSRYPKDMIFELPKDIDAVRTAIEVEQDSADQDNVKFSGEEIIAEITSPDNQTFTFTDLPGVFLVGETKMGGDYAESRKRNESLKEQTIGIIKKYLALKNTIVLVVVSASDWMHGLNNDNLIGYLAEWLEKVRKDEGREVPVYGVITKLDTQGGLSDNSPLKKVLLGTLPKNHILNGLGATRWIPMVSSPAVLAEGIGEKASLIEQEAVFNALKGAVVREQLGKLPIGRTALLRELKTALLHSISQAYGPMRQQVDKFVIDLDEKLKRLPIVAQPHEKRRMLDSGLKVLETTLNDFIGAAGRHLPSQQGERSLRIQLLVDGPEKFASELQVDLKGDILSDVEQLVNQAALEQGGSFDSDVTFVCLSQKIIERFRPPCMALVVSSAATVAEALRVATREAFGDYRLVSQLILEELGVPSGSEIVTEAGDLVNHFGDDGLPKKMFTFLTCSATDKILSLLDGLSTMVSCHPMWRNFDVLYHDVLLGHAKEAKSDPLQNILGLPELAKRARTEGEAAVAMYEQAKGVRITPLTKNKIAKHFARVEVMGYIIRSSLLGTVFPLVLRDIRDGLFRGVRCGGRKCDLSLSSVLRAKLLFDPQMEKRVMDMMDPSPADTALRTELQGKKETLLKLKKEFNDCSANLTKLITLFDSTK